MALNFAKKKETYLQFLKEFKAQPFTFSGLIREQLIIERFVPGTLFGADFLWYKNTWKLIGMTQQLINPKKSLCLLGMVFPADIPKELFNFIQQEILCWITSLELQGGAVNVEFKLINNKPILIEVNPRLPGVNVNKLITLAYKFSPIEYLIKQAYNLEPNLDSIKLKSAFYFADIYIFPSVKGRLTHIDTSKIPRQNLEQIELKKNTMRRNEYQSNT